MTQGNLAADLVLQASLEQRTLEKGLERREGQARVVQGSGAKSPFLNPREGRQRAHKGTLPWTIYPAFTSDSEVSDNRPDPPTPHVQAALRAKTSWDPGQWTGLQGKAHPGLYRGQCCQHLQSIWWGGGGGAHHLKQPQI